jgi:hypothetical protein
MRPNTDRAWADTVSWLAQPENPAVRFRTLTELLDLPADHPDVAAARAAVTDTAPVSQLLAAQKAGGYWIQRDYYLPKHSGTFWVLSALGDLGLTAEDEHIRRACDFMFTYQRENGAFCRRRRVPGQGLVWSTEPGPCTHARITRFLIQFGYAEHPRTRAAIGWLLSAQREDGSWHCHRPWRYGCLRATADVLRLAALDRETAALPQIARAARWVCDLLMKPRMGRYHVSDSWEQLEYPHFNYGVISTLDALARLGYTREIAQIDRALGYLLSRRLPDGSWPLDVRPRRAPFDVGEPGEPNRWVTLDSMVVVKLLGGCEEATHDR